jgi:shikimate dehydrogenase
MLNFGLIGYPLGHSFSKKYFEEKFKSQKIEATFSNFEVSDLSDFFANTNFSMFSGFSVTIPHKEKVINYLDELDISAKETKSVNVIKVISTGNKPLLKGYNTDIYGFEKSIKPLLRNYHKNALVLGSGGSSKSVIYFLKKLGIDCLTISRTPSGNKSISYTDLNKNIIEANKLIINTTPLGMFPETEKCPQIPYEYIGSEHLLFDLTYNPEETTFLKKGKESGAEIKNGLEMLHIQAEKAWDIWASQE